MFKKIEKESDYTIFFRQDLVNLNQTINVDIKNSKIEDLMAQVLANQPLAFELVDNMVVIKNKPVDYVISGTVTDSKGESLPGASVSVKGSNNAALTNEAGKFSLNISGNAPAILVVTYLGFQTKEVNVSSANNNITIILSENTSNLDEVVVIGYGTVKKRDLTGSVSSVKAEDIALSPVTSPMKALQGRVSGLDIQRGSGQAGQSPTVQLRGTRSLSASGNPLYIIDGMPSSINNLNPNDIESIEILKDASSTAIYGAQGANGVVIVTTKKGVSGQVKINYDAYYGINNYSFPKSRTGEDYLKLRREAARTVGITDDAVIFDGAGELNAIQNGQFVDWLDLVVQDGSQQSHNLSFNAGSEKTKVFASAGYFKKEGMLRNNNYNRYNLRLNLDQTLTSWAKAGVNSQVVYAAQNNRVNPLGQATQISPFGTPYDQDGIINQYPLPDGTTISPLADERTDLIARNNVLNTGIVANAYLEINPIKGLTFRSSLGTNLDFLRRGIYNDRTSLAQNNSRISIASQQSAYNRFFNWDNVITYNKVIKDHSITLTGITSYLQSDAEGLSASGQGQVLASQLFYDLNSTSSAITRSINSSYIGWNNLAYAARINYSYKGKYLLTASGRVDESSRLSPENRTDFFPSAAIGWNISEEDFIKKINFISNLKLRSSYGVSGNYNIDVYGTQSLLVAGSNMSFGDVPANFYKFGGRVGNPNLGWEKTATIDVGLDFGFLKNRITGTIDYYHSTTSDLLLPRSLAFSTGVEEVYENIGETQNKGLEIALTTQNFNKKDFKWSTTVTFSRNREEITKLIDGRNILSNSAFERNSLLLGYPITSFYSYQKVGIWQQDEAAEAAKYSVGGYTFQPGDIKLRDLNDDFKFDANDLSFIGSTVPDWYGGLQNNFSYKGFDLGVFLVARYGQTIDAEFLGRYNPSGTANGPEIID